MLEADRGRSAVCPIPRRPDTGQIGRFGWATLRANLMPLGGTMPDGEIRGRAETELRQGNPDYAEYVRRREQKTLPETRVFRALKAIGKRLLRRMRRAGIADGPNPES